MSARVLMTFLKRGAFAGLEVQALAHGVRNGEDIGKEDGRIQLRVAVQRLQGDFAGELRVHAQAHEVAGLGRGWRGIPAGSDRLDASSRQG